LLSLFDAFDGGFFFVPRFGVSLSSPVRIRMDFTAAPMALAGRFWP